MASVRSTFRRKPLAGDYPPVRRKLSALRSALESSAVTAGSLAKPDSGLNRSERRRLAQCEAEIWRARNTMLHVMATAAERLGPRRD